MNTSSSVTGMLRNELRKRFIQKHKGAVGNVAFSIYCTLLYFVLSDYYFSHGEKEIPAPFAVFAILFFLVEPLAIRYKLRIENYRRKSQDKFSFGSWFGGLIIVISRTVFRVVFLAVAIKSLAPGLWTEAVGWSLGLVALIKECHTLYLISKPQASQPKLFPEILSHFVLINQMVLFALFFTSMMRSGTDHFQWGIIQGLFYYFAFFLLWFLPNRIVEYYSDFIDLKTPGQKTYYYLSVVWIYITILFYARF